jgi:hypothetical protein
MSKSDVTIEQAQTIVERVAKELGLLVNQTSGFIKVQGPGNKHRVYIQKSRMLNRIDTTLPIPSDNPAYKALNAPNGSIVCHVQPTLEHLETALRMLADPSLGTQTPNKPRPFAVTKTPVPRKPRPTAEPVEEKALTIPRGGDLKERLAKIRESARRARINRILENPDKYGITDEAEAEALVDSKVSLDDYAANRAAQRSVEIAEIQAETGIQIDL